MSFCGRPRRDKPAVATKIWTTIDGPPQMDHHSLLQSLEDLLDQTRDVDFFIPDDTGLFQIDDALIRTILDLLESILSTMHEIAAHYDAQDHTKVEEDVGEADLLKELGAHISSQMAAQEIVDLAFVSRVQLKDLVSSIEQGMAEQKIWQIASDADTSLRRAGRALIALESSIREYEGLPMQRRYWQGVDDALAVRRAYAAFRRKILTKDATGDHPSGARLKERLRDVGGEIATLRVSEIYPYLRIDDRLELRRLQERIAGWLDQGSDEEKGRRLWGDLEGFAQLLAEISRRQELREHDRKVVGELWQRYFETHEASFAEHRPSPLGSDHLQIFRPLLGRDDDLDTILLSLRGRDSGHKKYHHSDLKPILERLRRELEQPYEERADELSTMS